MTYQGDSMNETGVQAGENGGNSSLPGRSVWGSGQASPNSQEGLLNGPLNGVRQDIENQMGQLIDHYASHVPGGERFTPEAKKAMAGVLDGLQQQLENEAASRLGNFGGAFGNQGNAPAGNQGSSL